MTCEALWYRSYTDDGPPTCRRLIRLPLDIQFFSSTDLALAIVEGRAGYRPVFRDAPASPREFWYYWPNPWNERGDTGWWLVPERAIRWARELIEAATDHECHRYQGSCNYAQIAHRLLVWQTSGHWRRKVRGRTPKDCIHEGYGAWYQQTFEPRRRRLRRAA